MVKSPVISRILQSFALFTLSVRVFCKNRSNGGGDEFECEMLRKRSTEGRWRDS